MGRVLVRDGARRARAQHVAGHGWRERAVLRRDRGRVRVDDGDRGLAPRVRDLDESHTTRNGGIDARKIVAGLFVSLDGVTESPEGWTFPYFDDELGQAIGAQMATSDAILARQENGHEEFAAYWPDADAPFADYINETPKYVVSTTLTSVGWRNSTLLRGDLVGSVAALKREPGRDISITGSVTLVRTLLGVGLVDELRLLLYPDRRRPREAPVRGASDQVAMKLVDSKTFGTGVISITYEPAGTGREAA